MNTRSTDPSTYVVNEKTKHPHKKPHGKCTTTLLAIYKSVGFLLFLTALLGFMISMLVMGGIYENKCPGKKNIPIWLIICGAIGFVLVAVKICSSFVARYVHPESDHIPSIVALVGWLSSALGFILLVWLIVGSVWIYGEKDEVSFDPLDTANYCNETCYLFAFWSLTSIYILIGVALIGGCAVVVISGILDDVRF